MVHNIMDTKVKDLVQSAIGKIQELSDTDTIIGKPIKIDGTITIIPVSKISYGFAAGGSDLPSKYDKELFAGASGAGVSVQPLAFIVVNDGQVTLMQMNQDKSTTAGIVNLVPELFNKIQNIFTKKKDTDSDFDSDIDIDDIKDDYTKSSSAIIDDISSQLGDTSDFDF